MQFPGETAYRDEAAAIVETMRSLSDEEFESGRTLCEQWAPRDVLAHLLGLDTDLDAYLRGVTIARGNDIVVRRYRAKSRDEIMEVAERWVSRPALPPRLAAGFLVGDLVMHHQDVLRPLGRTRTLDEAKASAILREGMVLGGYKLLSNRIEPTDGGRARGRGRRVRGTREVLGLWLAGRKGLEEELEISDDT